MKTNKDNEKEKNNFKKMVNDINLDNFYELNEAIEIIKKYSYENFDPKINLNIVLNLDSKKNDQQLRGNVLLPHGTGGNKKILAIVEKTDQKKAKDSGAKWVGGDEMLEKIKNEKWFDFDLIFTTPSMMTKFAKYGKILGTKGYIPSLKSGTISDDVEKTVKNLIDKQVEFRTDKFGNIGIVIGKKSFLTKKIVENYNSIISKLMQVKPSSLKGEYIKKINISTTMGKGINLILKR